MNRLEENEVITAINSSFYKNVFLLTQVLSPSLQFRQYFKKNMFDKPNTMGFLHVSHYLSVIYDPKLFKQMVSWPVLCKKDEVKYRIEIKHFFFVLSQDNPDINFPLILMSHLINSGGTRFLIIMWKLSQLAIRTYIRRELQEELLHMPCTSPLDDLTIIYFNNVIAEKYNVITETHKKTKRVLNAANNFLNNEIKILSVYKSEIFDRKENLKRLASNLLIHPLIQQRLMNVEDSNISLWKMEILEKIQYIRKQNKKLRKLDESCNRLYKLIVRINSNFEILDANKFPQVDCDNYSHLNCNLYMDGSIIFSALLSLLYVSFIRMQYHVNAANLSDLSSCLLYIQNACKNMKCQKTLFAAMNIKVSSKLRDKQYDFREIKDIFSNFDANSTLTTNRYIFLQSPKINFNFNQCLDNNFYEKLSLSSIQGVHKHLFKRYKRKYCSSSSLQGALSDFNSSWNNMSGWLSPRAHSTKYELISYNEKLLSPLYSRLLQRSKLRLKRSIDNTSYNPNSNYERLNITPKKRCSIPEHLIKNIHDDTARNLFNSDVLH